MSAPRLRLTRAQLGAVETAAAETYPEEACGLLVGRRAPGGAWRVRAVEASDNVAEPPRTRRFEVDPRLRLRLMRTLRGGRDEIIGVYHSHPDGGALPSDTDRAMIFEPAMIWLITAVDADGAGDTRAWRPTDDGTAFLPLGIELGDEDG